MYTKVIVPLDGSELSEQALPYARLVARSIAAPIELVQAYDILPPRLLGSRARGVVTSWKPAPTAPPSPNWNRPASAWNPPDIPYPSPPGAAPPPMPSPPKPAPNPPPWW